MKSINDPLFNKKEISKEEMNSLNGGGTYSGWRHTYVYQNGDTCHYGDEGSPDIIVPWFDFEK